MLKQMRGSLAVCLLLSCACTFSRNRETTTAAIEGNRTEEGVTWFHRANTQPQREEALRKVFADWGTGNAAHDSRVLKVLSKCYGAHKYGGIRTDEMLRRVIVERIKEKPELIRGVWLLERDKITDASRVQSLADYSREVFCDDRPDDEKFYYLLLTASMIDRPQIVTRMDAGRVEEAWRRATEWLEVNAARYQFDEKRREFVLRSSKAAKRRD